MITHGDTRNGKRTTEFKAWQAMKTRCNNPNFNGYKYYGGRGIKVCDRWLEGFENFLCDMGRKPSDEYSLERKNGELGYYPENCKWATRIEQLNNTRQNRFLEWDGKRMTVAQWGREIGIRGKTLRERIRKGYSVKEALTLPKGEVRKQFKESA